MGESPKELPTFRDRIKGFFSKPETAASKPPLVPMNELKQIADNLPHESPQEMIQRIDSERQKNNRERGKSFAQGRINSYEQKREILQALDERFKHTNIVIDRIPYWEIDSLEKWQNLFQTKGWSKLSFGEILDDKNAVEAYKELQSHASYETDKEIVKGVVDPTDPHQINETTQKYMNQVFLAAKDLRYLNI